VRVDAGVALGEGKHPTPTCRMGRGAGVKRIAHKGTAVPPYKNGKAMEKWQGSR